MSTCKNMKAARSVGLDWDSSARCYIVTIWWEEAGERMYEQTSFQSANDAIDTFTTVVKSIMQESGSRICMEATYSTRRLKATAKVTANK